MSTHEGLNPPLGSAMSSNVPAIGPSTLREPNRCPKSRHKYLYSYITVLPHKVASYINYDMRITHYLEILAKVSMLILYREPFLRATNFSYRVKRKFVEFIFTNLHC